MRISLDLPVEARDTELRCPVCDQASFRVVVCSAGQHLDFTVECANENCGSYCLSVAVTENPQAIQEAVLNGLIVQKAA